MQITELKRWHWAILGVVAGLLVAVVYSGGEPRMPRDVSGDYFRRAVTRTSEQEATRGQPLVRNIRVFPPVAGAYGKPVYPVIFEELRQHQGNPVWVEQGLKAETPFDGESGSSRTVVDYLRELESSLPGLDWRYAVERERTTALVIGGVGGLLLVGGVWPSLLGVMARNGMAAPPREKPAKAPAPSKAVAPMPAARTIDTRAVEAFNDKLESAIGPVPTSAAVVATASGSEPAVRKLDAKPDTSKPEAKKDEGLKPWEDPKYQGDFYPVSRAPSKGE